MHEMAVGLVAAVHIQNAIGDRGIGNCERSKVAAFSKSLVREVERRTPAEAVASVGVEMVMSDQIVRDWASYRKRGRRAEWEEWEGWDSSRGEVSDGSSPTVGRSTCRQIDTASRREFCRQSPPRRAKRSVDTKQRSAPSRAQILRSPPESSSALRPNRLLCQKIGQVRFFQQGNGGQVEQPRGHDAAAPPDFGHIGQVEIILVILRIAQRSSFGIGRALLFAGIGVVQNIQTLGVGSHQAVLDAVMNHFYQNAPRRPGHSASNLPQPCRWLFRVQACARPRRVQAPAL